jgi:hypothetical protein
MSMHFGILHTLFDVSMGAVLLYWTGRKIAEWMRHDTVAVVRECLMSELRRLRAPKPQPDREAAAELTTAAHLMYR